MKMEVRIQDLEAAAEEAGVEFRDGYSGRGMYGEQCCGVVYERLRDLLRFVVELCVQVGDHETVASFVVQGAQDSMGAGGIFYWPRMKKSALVQVVTREGRHLGVAEPYLLVRMEASDWPKEQSPSQRIVRSAENPRFFYIVSSEIMSSLT
ncbi:MAG: hypothetical protein V2A71_10480 [Candidatus Eisenbacteria bacterium]